MRVRKILLENREDAAESVSWPWLDERPKHVDKKRANKFLLGACIDYNIKADVAWENARILSEVILDDPDDLWLAINNMGLQKLKAVFSGNHEPNKCRRCAEGHSFVKSSAGEPKRHMTLHRFKNQAAQRVWNTMEIIIERYDGDVRKIWNGQPNDEIRNRLAGVKIGEQLSHMIIMALLDTEQIAGYGKLKADVNVNRVLGRVFTGDKVTPNEAHQIADKMEPNNTWVFDKVLFTLGQYTCTAKEPFCEDCILKTECVYLKNTI